MKRVLWLLLSLVWLSLPLVAQNQRYDVTGQVLSRATRYPIPYATVIVEGSPTLGASADSLGRFTLRGLKADIYRFEAFSLGYEPAISAQYIVSPNRSPVEILMNPTEQSLDSVVVFRSLLRRVVESPVSMRQIGLLSLERTAGANRDLSKVVQNYPGVAFSPAAYRNDLIVRGGSPSENRFYLDGFPLPNINHFSTQGASGGPVGLINADLVRQIDLYSGAFPISSDGALSSVIEIELRNGNPDAQRFKGSVGASEAAVSGSGHFSERSTYIFSLRRSYLQLLFAALELPLLPDYIDLLFKSRTKLSPNSELSFLMVGALDDMTLNENSSSPSGRYILSYLPTLQQKSFTLGSSYRHFDGSNSYSLYLSHSYLYNNNTKYQNNDDSSPENLTLRLRSTEQWTTLSSQNRSYIDNWTLSYGAKVGYESYSISSLTTFNNYSANIGYGAWGLYVGAQYSDPEERYFGSVGVRFDGASYSSRTAQFWRQFSPRIAFTKPLSPKWAAEASSGIYFLLPPFSALSYFQEGERINSHLSYSRVWESTLGLDFTPTRTFKLTLEGFFKDYGSLLFSLAEQIPLSDKGADYGTIGNEPLSQDVDGRAYGVELMATWQIPSRLSAVGSLTLFRSEYRHAGQGDYTPSAWDNGFILNCSATYNLARNWSVAAKVSAIGGAPYTPYDLDRSSLKEVWDATGRAQYDYSAHHTLRYSPYCQVDLRADKNYYFERWSIGFYLDIQNIFASQFSAADIPVSTGVIANPLCEQGEQRYAMRFIESRSGVLLPTIGINVEF